MLFLLILVLFYLSTIYLSYILLKNLNLFFVFKVPIYKSLPDNYKTTLLVLAALFIKRKPINRPAQLKYLRSFFEKTFYEKLSVSEYLYFKKLLSIDIPFSRISFHIKNNFAYGQKLQMLHFLFGIIAASSHVHQGDISLLHFLSVHIGIVEEDFHKTYQLYFSSDHGKQSDLDEIQLKHSYQLLNIPYDSTEATVRRAYRQKVKQFHPDLYQNKSMSEQNQAHEKFLEIKKAFHYIIQYLNKQKRDNNTKKNY